jgi:quercetin dioxygenase-like cupin family protein
MFKAGEVYENPVTGERAVVRVGTDENAGARLVVDLYIRPGGAVAGEHVHPAIHERFTVLEGRVGFAIGRKKSVAKLGETLDVPPGVIHNWWNLGLEEAKVAVEIEPAARFEEMIRNFFGLAQDGKTNARGMPHLLQLVMLAREFADVVQFTRPPRLVQRALFGVLAPVARLAGYRGSYPEYLSRPPSSVIQID